MITGRPRHIFMNCRLSVQSRNVCSLLFAALLGMVSPCLGAGVRAPPPGVEGEVVSDNGTITPSSPGLEERTPTDLAAAVWEPLGPEGGFFPHFLVSPTSSDTVLAGSDDSGGIWKTTDGGNSWRLVTEELRNVTGWRLAADPVHPQIVYATDIYGRHPFLRSDDGGETWTEYGTGLERCRTSCIAIDATTARNGLCQTIYVGTEGDDQDPQPAKGVLKSTDGGRTWARAALEGKAVPWIQITPSGTLLAATSVGLFRSTDGATTWREVEGGLPPATPMLGLTVTSRGNIYAATAGRLGSLYISDDDGRRWRGMGLDAEMIWDIVVQPGSNEQTIYCGTLGTAQGVMKTTDGGSSWTTASDGLTGKWIIGLARGGDGTLYCSNWSGEGIFRSRDGGQSWKQINRGLRATMVTGLALDPRHEDQLLVTCLGAYSAADHALAPTMWRGWFRHDGQATWQPVHDLKATTYSPAISPVDPDRILFGTFQKGAYFSRDGGATLIPVCKNGVCVATTFAGKDWRTALASVIHYDSGNTFLWRSHDAGDRWVREPVRFAVSRFATEPETNRVWAATGDGVYLSTDSGRTWRRAGLKGREAKTVAVSADHRLVLVAGQSFMAASKDDGQSWQTIVNTPWLEDAEIHEIVVDPTDPKRIYVALSGAEIKRKGYDVLRGGVWTSADGGKTWSDLTADLHNDHVWTMALSRDGRSLYIGTYGGGVLKRDLDYLRGDR